MYSSEHSRDLFLRLLVISLTNSTANYNYSYSEYKRIQIQHDFCCLQCPCPGGKSEEKASYQQVIHSSHAREKKINSSFHP